MTTKVFIIAEAGVNHNGSLKIARKMVDMAVWAGADAVKFQSFKAESLVSKFASKANYQKLTTGCDGGQLEMIRKLELSQEAHKELFCYCRKKKIIYISSPFDLESIDFLLGLGLEVFKIPSGEITNLPYLRKLGSQRKKIIISTGMSNLQEIRIALDVLIKCGTKKNDITVLHCNTEYPTPVEDVNLLAMLTIKDAFRVKVGYSDHTVGIEISIAAAALGAEIIEKHFTLDRYMEGPDHKSSLGPNQLKAMVMAIRKVEKSLGDGIKKPSSSELKNKLIVRKSLVAAKNIQKGEIFSEDNIAVKRPGTGINPMQWDNIIGKFAKKDIKKDELLVI